MSQHHTINYLEMPVSNIQASKDFFSQVFAWEFVDYGPEYSCFLNAGINGGFYLSEQDFTLAKGSPLVVLYSNDLSLSKQNVVAAGGVVSKDIFSFPGGRRFHFLDPNGNEFAVWSE
ncbi:VOC family protein [Shewanella sp. KX20019]|uniref:VOC family protein n=1 Tax=Shewanella sp. KX20019 TaxID=2803864 RepID=UPI001925E51E|nr:VOC family protein [Shewanella sp. KX20019]QQX78665.1 VOC family protein [Shewanella sp. KX20019]